jgi:hypothetical protein
MLTSVFGATFEANNSLRSYFCSLPSIHRIYEPNYEFAPKIVRPEKATPVTILTFLISFALVSNRKTKPHVQGQCNGIACKYCSRIFKTVASDIYPPSH